MLRIICPTAVGTIGEVSGVSIQPLDFRRAMQDQDLAALRAALVTSVSLAGLEGRIAEAEARVPTLWDVHDGEHFKPEMAWDESYLAALGGKLSVNFSRERFEHYCAVRQRVTGAFGGARSNRPQRSWVSIVIVLSLLGIGALVLFGPSILRIVFSNSFLMG